MSDIKKDEKLSVDVLNPNSGNPSSKVDELVDRVDPAVEAAAEKHVKVLLDFTLNNLDGQDAIKETVRSLGLDMEKENQKFSPMLQQTIGRVARDSESGDVVKALTDLKIQVEELDPSKFDFSPGWFSRTVGFLPFIGKPVKRYFTKFESAQTVLAAIMNSLQKGKEELIRDNKTLAMDQKRMRELTLRLKKAIEVVMLMDEKITYKVEREMQDGEEKKFVQEEVLFPLRQRILDLQQSLAVNQQGVMALDVVINNNKELIKGAERCQSVTTTALNTAIVVALALGNQKIVLDKIAGITTATNNIMKGTAERLRTQGVEIHNRASSAALDIDALKSAFKDINQAMEDMSKFKVDSLAKMSSTIKEMGELNTESEQRIKDMEKGKKVREKLIDLEEK